MHSLFNRAPGNFFLLLLLLNAVVIDVDDYYLKTVDILLCYNTDPHIDKMIAYTLSLSLRRGLTACLRAPSRGFITSIPLNNTVENDPIEKKETHRKRPTEWTLPDLDKLPGGFRGKVYNRRDWVQYLSKNTKILEQSGGDVLAENVKKPLNNQNLKAPPAGWRNNKNLPMWQRQKYALREKQLTTDLSKVKKVSPATIEGIRRLHEQYPEELTTDKIAEFFKISPVAVSKILKSRWRPNSKELARKEKKFIERNQNRFKERLIEKYLQEFFDEKEKELQMEIPFFIKEKLHDHYKLYGTQTLQPLFDELNEAQKKINQIKTEKKPLDNQTTIY